MRVFSKVTIAVTGLMLLSVSIWAAARYGLTQSLFSTSFLAHQYCYLRQPALIWTNAAADGFIWLSYLAIAAGLLALLWRTKEFLPFHWVFVAFGTFILACGFTHFFEMVTLWNPVYWLSTSVKVLTALASVATAVAFVPLVPRVAGAIQLFHQAYSKSEEQRVQTLSKLLDTEERMKLAMESSGFATWERSLITKELYWDERCRAIFGVTDDRPLFYEDFLRHIYPDDRASTQALIETSLREQNEYTATFRIVRDDGEIRTVLSRGKAFCNEDGQPARLVGIILDITRERQAEEALIKAEKLAVAGRMAAIIAHEINNPLSAAMGNVFLARIAKGIPQEVGQRLETVEAELNRAGQITQSTLTFYRESPSPVKTNPVELVESVLTFQQGNIRKAGVEVDKDLVYSQPLYAFPGELRQVFTNLIANAIDAMQGRDARLMLRVRPAKDWRTNTDGYRMVVADNGPGIPRESRKRIFEAFYTSKGEKGTGLGLWISKQLVEKNGGSINFRSCWKSSGGGTVFSVWLPLQQASKSSVEVRAAETRS